MSGRLRIPRPFLAMGKDLLRDDFTDERSDNVIFEDGGSARREKVSVYVTAQTSRALTVSGRGHVSRRKHASVRADQQNPAGGPALRELRVGLDHVGQHVERAGGGDPELH